MPDALRPLFDHVVIKELEPDRMRKSGLLAPQGTHDLYNVVSYWSLGSPPPLKSKDGDTALLFASTKGSLG